MNMKYYLAVFSFTALIIYIFSNCARQVAPTGGPRDTIAPRVISYLPEYNTAFLNTDKIKITFDEYVTLKNTDQNLMVSPPVKTKPEIKLKGKKIVIDLSECQLRENTTYTIIMNNIVHDITEKNPITNFDYVFSTGESTDSMQVSGRIYNAQTLEPVTDIFVMLYSNLNDTAFKTSIPEFIAKTDKTGNFTIKNVKETEYKLYALKDLDRDLTYNQETEMIGYIDSIITPSAEVIEHIDTIYIDTIDVSSDSLSLLQQDTIGYFKLNNWTETVYSPNNLSISLFLEKPKKQYIKSNRRQQKELLILKFNKPLINDSVTIDFIPEYKEAKYSIENISNNDSLFVWLNDENLISNDTLKFKVGYVGHDSTGNETWKIDTIIGDYSAKKDPNKGRIKNIISSNIAMNQRVSPSDTFFIRLSNPIEKYDKSSIHLYETIDTTAIIKSDKSFFVTDTSGNELYDNTIPPPAPEYKNLEEYDAQKILKYRYGMGKFAIKFAKPITDENISIRSLDYPELTDFIITEKDIESNSLLCWVTDERIQVLKQPRFSVSYGDSTTTVPFKIDEDIRGDYRNPKKSKIKLYINESQEKGLVINEMLEIICANPIKYIDTSKISIINTADSIPTGLEYDYSKSSLRRILFSYNWQRASKYIIRFEKDAITDIFDQTTKEWEVIFETQKLSRQKITEEIPFTITEDPNKVRSYIINADWKQAQGYRLTIDNGTFTDIYHKRNNEFELDFEMPSSEAYGNLDLVLSNVQGNCIIMLYNEGYKKCFRTLNVNTDETIRIASLTPQEYYIKVIFDDNNNGKYDIGDLEEKIQPEAVGFWNEKIKVKANWDIKQEINFDELQTMPK